jgi:mRNA-degrading endonuclease toxin of MazEF toxin-antitoxin module
LALSPFWTITAAVGFLLEACVIHAMQKTSRYRTYPLLFSYVILLFLTASVEAALLFGLPSLPANRKVYALYYWSNDAILQILIFAVMLSLIHRATEGFPRRWRWTVIPALIVTGILANSLYAIGSQPGVTRHMTVISRNLGFCTALLNAVLWAALMRNRRRSTELLLVSGGIGLQTTGKAIGHSLRALGTTSMLMGNLAVVLSHLLCLLIWWRTFRRPAPRPALIVSQAVSSDG